MWETWAAVRMVVPAFLPVWTNPLLRSSPFALTQETQGPRAGAETRDPCVPAPPATGEERGGGGH